MSLKRKHKKRLIIGILVVLIITAGLVYKTIYKPHIGIQDREVKFTGTTSEILEKVQKDPSLWQDVAVQLRGKITDTEAKGFSLDNSVYCQLDTTSTQQKTKPGDLIVIKGRIIGYDDLLEELKLDQTIILTN